MTYEDLHRRTGLVRAEAVSALKRSGIRLRGMPGAGLPPALARDAPDLVSLLAGYFDTIRLDDTQCRGRPDGDCCTDPVLESMLRYCADHFASQDAVAGTVALLFATETIALEQDGTSYPAERRVAAFRSIVDLALRGPDGAEMLEANAFFVYSLITATVSTARTAGAERPGRLHRS